MVSRFEIILSVVSYERRNIVLYANKIKTYETMIYDKPILKKLVRNDSKENLKEVIFLKYP